jgi:hypothetical protein
MKYKLTLLSFLFCLCVTGQTLRINEFSNGPSGSKEWIELLVAPTSPTAASLRGCFTNSLNCVGWIIDDNDGTFSPTNNNFGSGFATGHLRFKNVAPWTRLPVGALIVIYNDLDKDPILPADDPYDFNNDCVYVLPATHISLEYCTTAPIALTCSTKLDYSSCVTYTTGNWNTINASNAGDGMQIRDASYSLIHGIVYGRTTLSSCGSASNMLGNSISPFITTTNGANTFYAYNGLDLSGYYDASQWITGTASSATPGLFNNANNQIWIQDTIRKGCICDVTLNLDVTTHQTTRPKSNTLKYKVFGNHIVFHENENTNINIVLISTDGKILDKVNTWFKGDYTYIINNCRMNILIVNSVSGYGRFSSYVIKHINL